MIKLEVRFSKGETMIVDIDLNSSVDSLTRKISKNIGFHNNSLLISNPITCENYDNREIWDKDDEPLRDFDIKEGSIMNIKGDLKDLCSEEQYKQLLKDNVITKPTSQLDQHSSARGAPSKPRT